MEPTTDYNSEIQHDFYNLSSSSSSDYSFNDEALDYQTEESQSNFVTLEEEDFSDEYKDYNPNSKESIICVELMNNNKLFLNYDPLWKIRDLFAEIFNHKEFCKLYNHRNIYHNSNLLENIFDLQLLIFRSIKEDTESKIDLDICIGDLSTLGLLKSHKYPFLKLSDSRNFNKISKNEDFVKSVYENSLKILNFKALTHLDLIYRDYLPRIFISYFPKNHCADVPQVYLTNKKSINVFSQLTLDPLIGEEQSQHNDWFIYDDESLNYLISEDTFEISPNANIKFRNEEIFFQDKLPYMILPNKEYKYIFITIHINKDVKMKIDVNLTSTSADIFKKVNTKLQKINPEEVFDSNYKILKAFNIW